MSTKEKRSKLIQGLQDYFDNTSPEQLEKDWKDLDKFNQYGPDIEECLELGRQNCIKMMKEMDNIKVVMEFDIELTTVQDCEFVLDVIKNTNILCELYLYNYNGNNHISCVIYVDADRYKELISKYPIFENIDFDEYELDEESNDSLVSIKTSVIDDINELKDIYARLEQFVTKCSIDPQD